MSNGASPTPTDSVLPTVSGREQLAHHCYLVCTLMVSFCSSRDQDLVAGLTTCSLAV